MASLTYKTKPHKTDEVKKQIEDALSRLKEMRDKSTKKGNIITTGNYPNLGWNSTNI